MCLEDVKIARATRTNVYRVSNSMTIGPNVRRLSITVVSDLGDSATVKLKDVSAIGFIGAASPALAIHYNDPAGVVYPLGAITPVPTVHLADIGDLFLGTLLIQSDNGSFVTAYETYLDTNTGQSNDVEKLP